MDDKSNIEHVFKDFIKTFVLKRWHDRLFYFLEHKKKWRWIDNMFHVDVVFDPRKMIVIENKEASGEIVYEKLRALGAEDTCLSLLELDRPGHMFDLKEKLIDSVGYSNETIIYCPVSRIAYWEGGHMERRILKP